MVGFVAAVLSFWDIVIPSQMWSPPAVGSSIVSLGGILLFFGTWPMFNTLAAIAVNVAVLVTQLWMRWPDQAILGR